MDVHRSLGVLGWGRLGRMGLAVRAEGASTMHGGGSVSRPTLRLERGARLGRCPHGPSMEVFYSGSGHGASLGGMCVRVFCSGSGHGASLRAMCVQVDGRASLSGGSWMGSTGEDGVGGPGLRGRVPCTAVVLCHARHLGWSAVRVWADAPTARVWRFFVQGVGTGLR